MSYGPGVYFLFSYSVLFQLSTDYISNLGPLYLQITLAQMTILSTPNLNKTNEIKDKNFFPFFFLFFCKGALFRGKGGSPVLE